MLLSLFQRRKGRGVDSHPPQFPKIPVTLWVRLQTCVLTRSGAYAILDATSTIWRCSYKRHPQCSRIIMLTLARCTSLVWHQSSVPAVQCSKAQPPLLFTTTFLAQPAPEQPQKNSLDLLGTFAQRPPNSQWPQSQTGFLPVSTTIKHLT